MKICVVGDLHCRFDLPYSTSIEDGRKSEWKSIKEVIHNRARSCDAVVLLGDNFNARHNHSTVIKDFVDFLNGFGDKEIHILCGNHERYGESTALDFLKRLNKETWHVYTEPTATEICGLKAMMIPFMTPSLLNVETNEEGAKEIIKLFPKEKSGIAFAHHVISGSKINGISADSFNEIILPKKEMEKKFGMTFSGHVHKKQRLSESVIMTGSIITQEVGEHSKSIWEYENGEAKEIALPVRGIYKVQIDQHTTFPTMPKDSIVKCYLTDRSADVERIKKHLSTFDASILIEQYPSERQKVHFDEGSMDFSVESLLKLYAKAKKIDHKELQKGFNLINDNISK